VALKLQPGVSGPGLLGRGRWRAQQGQRGAQGVQPAPARRGPARRQRACGGRALGAGTRPPRAPRPLTRPPYLAAAAPPLRRPLQVETEGALTPRGTLGGTFGLTAPALSTTLVGAPQEANVAKADGAAEGFKNNVAAPL
jgi:hypothetical protein